MQFDYIATPVLFQLKQLFPDWKTYERRNPNGIIDIGIQTDSGFVGHEHIPSRDLRIVRAETGNLAIEIRRYSEVVLAKPVAATTLEELLIELKGVADEIK